MSESSRTDFEKLSLGRFSTLIEIIRESGQIKSAHLRETYLRQTSNFEEVFAFLEIIGVIVVEGDVVKLGSLQVEDLKRNILTLLFKRYRKELTGLYEYLKPFHLSDPEYSYKPQQTANLLTSGVRNLLIELDFLERDRDTGVYRITSLGKEYVRNLSKKTSAVRLERVLREQDKIGLAAEKVVLEFEKDKLREVPELLKFVKHISRDDVGAGYDIETVAPLLEGGYTRKFIEVKALSSDSDFYWSSNEIEIAKEIGSRYYLYLLPVIGDGKFDLERMKVIQDPHQSVFLGEDLWDKEPVIFHIAPRQ